MSGPGGAATAQDRDRGTVRVVVADDHARLRQRLVALLRAGGCEVVGEASTAGEAVEKVVALSPDVVVLDVHMPGSGITAAEQLTRRSPGVAIMMLTQSDADEDVFGAIRAGAASYLLKDRDVGELAARVRELAGGTPVLSGPVTARLLDEFRAPSRARAHRNNPAAAQLTAREWEVMELLMQGCSTEEVATRLVLSPTTVRVHVSSVTRKLRVRDRDAAIARLRGSH